MVRMGFAPSSQVLVENVAGRTEPHGVGDVDPPGNGIAGVEVGGRAQDRCGVAQDRTKRLELFLRHMAGARGGADLPGAVDLQLGCHQGEIGIAGPLPPPAVEPSGVVQREFGQGCAVFAAPVPVQGGARPRQQFRRGFPGSRPGGCERSPQSGVRPVHLDRPVRRQSLAGGRQMPQHPRQREHSGQLAHNPVPPPTAPGRTQSMIDRRRPYRPGQDARHGGEGPTRELRGIMPLWASPGLLRAPLQGDEGRIAPVVLGRSGGHERALTTRTALPRCRGTPPVAIPLPGPVAPGRGVGARTGRGCWGSRSRGGYGHRERPAGAGPGEGTA